MLTPAGYNFINYLFKPKAFKNVTNGIAYRRWLLASNPELCKLLDETIGDGYKHDASDLTKLNRIKCNC